MTSMSVADDFCRDWSGNMADEDGIEQSSTIVPLTSSFTAINGTHAQLCTPPQLSASLPIQQNQGRRRVATTKRRRRNPTVARYLGLGLSSVSNYPEQNVSASDGTRKRSASTSKRRKLGNKNDAMHHDVQSGNQNTSVQTRVSETLRVTKSRHSSAVSSKVSHHETESFSSAPAQDIAAQTSLNLITQTSGAESRRSHCNSTILENTEAHVEDLAELTSSPTTLDDHLLTPHPVNEVYSEFDVSEQLGHVMSGGRSIFDDDDQEFDDDLDDEEFLELTYHVADLSGSPTDLPSSPCGSGSTHTVYVDEECPSPDTKPSTSSEKTHGDGNSERSSKKFVSPMTLTYRLLASIGDIDRADARKPIARSPFPGAVRDRSPIIGLESDTLLRTCFRIGEAINQAHHSSKTGKHVVFELYARILESSRNDAEQQFTFCDLFHGKPPHIKGIYEGAKWQSIQLFDYDSKRLLQQGRICRCMGTMKRDGKEWIMNVSSVWEATWDDIKWVEGIVNA